MKTSSVRERLKPWFEKFAGQSQVPMDDGLSKAFMVLSLAEMQGKEAVVTDELRQQFLFKVGVRRAEYMGLEITPFAVALLCCIAGSPGGMVMYLSYLTSVGGRVDIDRIANLFPHGFPHDKSMSLMWDEQKGRMFGEDVDNMLDHLEPL